MELKEIKVEGYQKIIQCIDEKTKLNAMIAIHHTKEGIPCLGGCRMVAYPSDEEMLNNVLELSKGMSYKNAMAGLKFGGNKCSIRGDPYTQKTPELLTAMAEFINSFEGQIYTGQDANISAEDVKLMAKKTKYLVGLSSGSGDPSTPTAVGLYHGLKACLKFIGKELKDVTVAINGLGNVGSKFAIMIYPEVKKLIIYDVEKEKTLKFQETYKDVVITENILDEEFDVFCPCALKHSITKEAVEAFKKNGCRIIAGCENNQLDDKALDKELFEAGILYAPDYVINAGGVISVASDLDPSIPVKDKVRKIGDTVFEILERSKKENLPPDIVADKIAEERIYS